MQPALVRAAVLAGVIAAGLSLLGDLPPPPDDTPLPTAKPYGLGTPPFAQVSGASCAASGCHGGGQVGRKGSEHSTWSPQVFEEGPYDPHSHAYRVLFNADSQRIGKLLKIAEPHKEGLCLKCHAVDGVSPAGAAVEGVGCGACHGPAEKWIGAHVQPAWKGLSNRAKWEEFGFVPAENLVARSLNCVGCHVGDAEKEVNHDLIAAGHPRLNFESARFHFNPKYRKHWEEVTPQPDFEVRAWTAGQAATVRAATELLRARAGRAANDDPHTPWPEFSGLSCYACHQTIAPGETRREAASPKRPVGIAGWEVWSNTGVGVAANLCPEAFPSVQAPQLIELTALRKLMEKRNPDPKAVAKRAGRAVAELDAWLAALQESEDRCRATRVPADAPRKFTHALAANALSPDRTRLADHDWDALAANYLGAGAMYHAAGGKGVVPRWTDPLRGLAGELKFPARKPGERYDSPATFGPVERGRVRDRFHELLDATAEPRGKP